MKIKHWILMLVLFFAGCKATISDFIVSKTQKEKEIAALRVDFEKKLKDTETQIIVAKDKTIEAKDAQIRGGANAFYAQDAAFKTIIQPTRTDLIVHNYALEGWQALGNIMPDYDTMVKINQRLKNELDETKTTLEDLKKNHEAAINENKKLVAESERWKAEISNLEKQKSDLTRDFNIEFEAKQNALNAINAQIIAAQDNQLRNDEAVKAAKMKISLIAGILALACMAGAVWSPIAKDKFIIFGAVCGMASVGIWYITPYIVAGTVVVAGLGVTGVVLYRHRKDERVSDSLVLAMQDIKDKDPEKWAKEIGPLVEERLKVYKKKGGTIVAEKDPAIEKYIDQKLAEYDRK